MGEDARDRGVHFLLAPGVNIYRTSLNGRNMEYFGEDLYLASRIAVGFIEGLQSKSVAATVKHFAANNTEHDRQNINAIIDERTLREIYLPAFEAAVKEAHVGAECQDKTRPQAPQSIGCIFLFGMMSIGDRLKSMQGLNAWYIQFRNA